MTVFKNKTDMCEVLHKYKKETEKYNCHSLYWVRPRWVNKFSENISNNKSVFFAHMTGEGVWDLIPLSPDRAIFECQESYFNTQLIPFEPKVIVQFGLEDMFDGYTRNRLMDLSKDPDWAMIYEETENIVHNLDRMHKPPEIKMPTDVTWGALSNDWRNRLDEITVSGCETGSFVLPAGALTNLNLNKEETNMGKVQSVAKDIKDKNIDAAKVAGKLAAGKALNTAVQTKVVPKLPLMIRGYASTPFGGVVMANVVATALTHYAPDNPKVQMLSEAMLQSAMVDLLSIVDIEGMVTEFLSSDEASRVLKDES